MTTTMENSFVTPAMKMEPHSPEAEASVLGGIFLNNSAMDQVADRLRPEYFYSERNRILFAIMLDLHGAGKPMDPVTVLEAVQTRNAEKKIDAMYIADLADAVPSLVNLQYHADIVQKNAVLRNIIGTCQRISDEAFSGVPDMEDFLDRAESRFMEVSQTRTSEGPRKVAEHLPGIFKKLEEQAKSGGNLTGLDTGYYQLNEMTMGLQAGDLIILAARPSMGKTAFSLNLLSHCIARSQRPGVFFSLEMPAESLVIRLICARARVKSDEFRRGIFSNQSDYKNVITAVNSLKEQSIFIDDTGYLSLMDLRSKCRRLKSSEKDLGLIVIDYLQLMQGDKSIASREQQISTISRGLKSLARELAVPVIALSQLNRQVERRDDKRPTMADLRESGAIEQDADLIAFLYRDEVYNKESSEAGTAELILAKHRNGQIGSMKFKFFKEFGLFENLATEPEY